MLQKIKILPLVKEIKSPKLNLNNEDTNFEGVNFFNLKQNKNQWIQNKINNSDNDKQVGVKG